MNVLDLKDDAILRACSTASNSLMWDARQQTNPMAMLRHAAAAACVDLYASVLTGSSETRKQMFEVFDLYLNDERRGSAHGRPKSDGIDGDLQINLVGFLTNVAKVHAEQKNVITIYEADNVDFMGDFITEMIASAVEVATTDDSGREAHVDALHKDAQPSVSLKEEASTMRESSLALDGGHSALEHESTR